MKRPWNILCIFQVCKLQGFQLEELDSLCFVVCQLSVPCKSHSVWQDQTCVCTTVRSVSSVCVPWWGQGCPCVHLCVQNVCLFLSGVIRTKNKSDSPEIRLPNAVHKDKCQSGSPHQLQFSTSSVCIYTLLWTFWNNNRLSWPCDIPPPRNPSRSQGLSLRCSGSPVLKPEGSLGSSGWWMGGSFLVQMPHLYSDTDS